MNAIFRIVIVSILLLTSGAQAQELQGVAYYKSKRKVSITLDSTSAAAGQQAELNKLLKKQFEKEYTLNFDKTTSVFKEVESLGSAEGASGIQIQGLSFGLGGGDDVLYKNTKDKIYVNQQESFSKQFLIEDTLVVRDWKLENETKQIGNYTCYKATYTREVEQRQLNFSDAEKKDSIVKKTIITTAWYTPQIPVSHGPARHWGLPGLILEVNDGSSLMICTKVVINPKEKVAIAKPKKGKKVTQEEYNEILLKKTEEMNKVFGGGKKRGNGQTIKLRIGG